MMILAAHVFGAGTRTGKPRDLITVERTVEKFDRIKISGPIELVVITGMEQQKVMVTSDSKYLHTISTETHNGELEICMTGLLKLKNVSEVFKVEIWTDDLKNLSAAGLAKVTFPEKTTLCNLSIITAGVSQTTFNDLEITGKLNAEISGASHLIINGYASKAAFEGSGACNVTFNGSAGAISLEMSGACKTFITAESERMDIEASGACRITLTGHTSNLKLEASGATCIRSEKFKAENRSVSFSGAAKISIVD